MDESPLSRLCPHVVRMTRVDTIHARKGENTISAAFRAVERLSQDPRVPHNGDTIVSLREDGTTRVSAVTAGGDTLYVVIVHEKS